MKEQILHLDPHDDFISARDKMGWVQTQRVLLVWPPRGHVLRRRLDLMLLHRHARKLGAHLALITDDLVVREHADELGLPVFLSVEESRRARWRGRLLTAPPERRRPRPDFAAPKPPRPLKVPSTTQTFLSWMLHGLVLAISLGAVVALALVLVPGATVTLTPAAHLLHTRFEVTADPQVKQVDAPGLIPARAVRVEVEDTAHVATTGVKDVPAGPATGRVIFTNLIGTPAAIPQGTSVRTSSGVAVRFVTSSTVTIEGRIGAMAEAAIVADKPGLEGNVAAAQINAIDGPLGLQLAVTNPAPTRGGATTQKAAVTQADRQQVRVQLLELLQTNARDTLVAHVQADEFLITDTLTVTEILAETYDWAVGEQADALGLTMRLAMTGLAVSNSDVRRAAQYALAAELPPGEAPFSQEIYFERASLPVSDADGRVHFSVTASGAAVPHFERETVRQLVRGLPIGAARETLAATLPLAEPPRLEVWPVWYADWFGRVPWVAPRITVVVQAVN